MNGYNSDLDVFENHLTITTRGVLGFLKRVKITPFSSISSIQFKKASFFPGPGYLDFRGNEIKRGFWGVVFEEKSFVFHKNIIFGNDVNEAAEKIKNYIEFKSTQLENPQNAKTSITGTADEHKKLSDSLVNCKDCGKKVSPNAEMCPHCGAPFPKKPFKCKTIACKMFFIGIILICLVWVVPLFFMFFTLLVTLLGF